MSKEINLYGRIRVTGKIKLITGLHIGRGNDNISIGGLDNAIMRDPRSNQPYIPGASLKGKLRSLAERREPNLLMNTKVGRDVFIHTCEKEANPEKVCVVCKIFGMPGQAIKAAPTRLLVRDVFMTDESSAKFSQLETDLPYTEIKYEASIDRITSAANPRPMERVPAGAEFGTFEMLFSIYEENDVKLFPKLLEYMRLLEDDYLGGSGSRGYGKIEFSDLLLRIIPVMAYSNADLEIMEIPADNLIELQTRIESDIKEDFFKEFLDG